MDAEGDDMLMQGSSSFHSPLELNLKEQALSSEDLAWVDSCLVPNVPESSWDSLRDALLDVLISKPANIKYPDFGGPQMLSADEEVDGRVGNDLEEKKGKSGNLVNELRFENALLPTYKEGVSESVIADEEEDALGFFLDENETEPSVAEIFKVWELESAAEESDFITQLNKALKYRPPFPNAADVFNSTLLQTVNDSAFAKSDDIKDESIDYLVAGIAELSL